jgi:hypothetical protein
MTRFPLSIHSRSHALVPTNLFKTVLFSLVVFFLMGTSLAADSKTTPPRGEIQKSAPMMQMPLIAPMFVEDSDFTSTLVLVNAAAVDSYADVNVRDLSGTVIASQRVLFSPQTQRRVKLGTLLRSSGSSATTGSILVIPPSDSGGAIAAALSMTYRTNPEPNYVDEELAMPSMSNSQVLRAVADSGEGSPLVAISSLAESVQEVQIECLGKDEVKSSKVVELAAGETLLTEACEQQTVHGTDFESIWKGMKDTPRGPIGIALRSNAMPGSFAAFALSPHALEQERFFSSVPFTDPKMLMSGTTVFAGVPVGSTALLPEGHYVPQLSLSNFSSKDSTVKVRYSKTSGDSPRVRDLDSVVVPAMRSKEILLENIEGDGELMNSFLTISDATPGDVMAKLVAKGDSQLREVELLGKDGLGEENAGAHPWSLEHGTESILVLFNHGIGAQYFTVLVSADKVIWRKAYLLKPMQTKAINIRDLVEKRVRDEKGKVLPRTAVRGEVGWVSAGKGIGKGRILQSNPRTAMARSFSCGSVTNPNSPATVTLTPTSPIALGSSTNAHLQVGFFTTQPGQYGCGGALAGYDLTGFSVSWYGNTNIVSIPPSNGYDVTVTGTAVGSGSVNANISGPTCGTGAGASITVSCAVPTNVHVTSCSDAGNGDLHFDYGYSSTDGNLQHLGSCTLGEIVTYQGSQNPWPFPAPFPPDAYDNPTIGDFNAATGGPNGPGTFTDDHKLTPSITFRKPYNANSFTATQYYRYKCSCAGGGQYVNIVGPLSIVRSVSQNANGTWKFTVTKSGCSAQINPLP